MSDTQRTTPAPKRATPAAEIVSPIMASRLSDPATAGIRFRENDLDRPFNHTCPDWCSMAGGHRANVYTRNTHYSDSLYVVESSTQGYAGKAPGVMFAASHAVYLVRGQVNTATHVKIKRAWGDESRQVEKETWADLTVAEARTMVEALQFIIGVAEADEGLS